MTQNTTSDSGAGRCPPFLRAVSMAICDRPFTASAAEAVLAMPEMQAIKVALRSYLHEAVWQANEVVTSQQLKESLGLPESVIEWVLS